MKHVASLRLSLLVSLGLIPVACGGTALRGNSDDDTSGSGGGGTSSGASQGGKKPTSAGSSSKGGSFNVAGATSGGGTVAVGGATSTGGTTVVGGAGPSQTCTKPTLDPATGLISCNEGFRHRPSAKRCDGVPDPGPIGGASGEGGADGNGADPLPRAPNDGSVSCTRQPGDCSQYQFGYCGFVGQMTACLSGCSTDAECGAGHVCHCGEPLSPTGGECVPSDCKTDADCGADSFCASYSGICGGAGFACLRASDQCVGNDTCTCTWSPDRGRYCNDAVCGRPFLVEAETRVAPVVSGTRWSTLDAVKPRVDHLTFAERALLAEHWTRMGQMEHASIAAFARFSLQLLALGAPPELVEGCTAALADETAHTQLCFGIASVYAGHAVGPGPLDVSGNLLPTSLVDIVELVIAEGCFGETSAALEALQAAETASDPVIAAAYQRIATDEQRHAELAFRFVRWALERAPREVASCVRRAIVAPPSTSLGVNEVSVPCLRALLERSVAARKDFAA
jgi:hypothetical protein